VQWMQSGGLPQLVCWMGQEGTGRLAKQRHYCVETGPRWPMCAVSTKLLLETNESVWAATQTGAYTKGLCVCVCVCVPAEEAIMAPTKARRCGGTPVAVGVRELGARARFYARQVPANACKRPSFCVLCVCESVSVGATLWASRLAFSVGRLRIAWGQAERHSR